MKYYNAFKNLLPKYLAASWKEQVSSTHISHKGFTLVEVLVSILIASLFVATAMQAMVVASLFKAKARQYAEAVTWIQEDLENVKHTAATLLRDDTKCDPSTGSQEDGYAHYLRINLSDLSPSDSSINEHTATKTITGGTYILTRDGPEVESAIRPNVKDSYPHNLMTLKYEVKPDGGGDAIATINTEVVPDAAFQCP